MEFNYSIVDDFRLGVFDGKPWTLLMKLYFYAQNEPISIELFTDIMEDLGLYKKDECILALRGLTEKNYIQCTGYDDNDMVSVVIPRNEVMRFEEIEFKRVTMFDNNFTNWLSLYLYSEHLMPNYAIVDPDYICILDGDIVVSRSILETLGFQYVGDIPDYINESVHEILYSDFSHFINTRITRRSQESGDCISRKLNFNLPPENDYVLVYHPGVHFKDLEVPFGEGLLNISDIKLKSENVLFE